MSSENWKLDLKRSSSILLILCMLEKYRCFNNQIGFKFGFDFKTYVVPYWIHTLLFPGIDSTFFYNFSPSEEDCRPQEDMAELLQKSLHMGPSLDVTTGTYCPVPLTYFRYLTLWSRITNRVLVWRVCILIDAAMCEDFVILQQSLLRLV
jgi:hypothetical protein